MTKRIVSSVLLAALLSACSTEIGETTQMGAATGGVIGAGLGAIVGSQSGDAGTGLVIGAAAGAGTGAAVGNMIEGQQTAMRTQDEAIERQQRTLQAQKAELDELRRMNPDSNSSYHQGTSQRVPTGNRSTFANSAALAAPRVATTTTTALAERNLLTEERVVEPPQPLDPANEAIDDSARGSLARFESADCQSANTEMKNAESAREAADKLFHLRRALRLCPENPKLHNALGQTYSSMGRRADAEFEFKEALKVDPNFQLAQENLNSLGTTR